MAFQRIFTSVTNTLRLRSNTDTVVTDSIRSTSRRSSVHTAFSSNRDFSLASVVVVTVESRSTEVTRAFRSDLLRGTDSVSATEVVWAV